MKNSNSNPYPWLLYIDHRSIEAIPDDSALTQPGSTSFMSWPEMIQDIKLGDQELDALIGLGTDLSMEELSLLHLYYWKGHTEKELGEMVGVSHVTISKWLQGAKKKIYPALRAKIMA